MRLHVLESGQDPYGEGSCLIVPVFSGEQPLSSAEIEQTDLAQLEEARSRKLIKGSREETYFMPTPTSRYDGVITLGVGDAEEFSAETLRRAAGATTKLLARNRISHVVFDGTSGVAMPVEAFVEGLMHGQYDYTSFNDKDDKDET